MHVPIQVLAIPAGEEPAGEAYRQLEQLLQHAPPCAVSVFCFLLPVQECWCLAIVGNLPEPSFQASMEQILTTVGAQPCSLPPPVLAELVARWLSAQTSGIPWTTRHFPVPGTRTFHRPQKKQRRHK